MKVIFYITLISWAFTKPCAQVAIEDNIFINPIVTNTLTTAHHIKLESSINNINFKLLDFIKLENNEHDRFEFKLFGQNSIGEKIIPVVSCIDQNTQFISVNNEYFSIDPINTSQIKIYFSEPIEVMSLISDNLITSNIDSLQQIIANASANIDVHRIKLNKEPIEHIVLLKGNTSIDVLSPDLIQQLTSVWMNDVHYNKSTLFLTIISHDGYTRKLLDRQNIISTKSKAAIEYAIFNGDKNTAKDQLQSDRLSNLSTHKILDAKLVVIE